MTRWIDASTYLVAGAVCLCVLVYGLLPGLLAVMTYRCLRHHPHLHHHLQR